MRRALSIVALASMVALAGCGALTGGSDDPATATPGSSVSIENDSPEATDVNQTLRTTVGEDGAGSEWSAIGATYPRDQFTVHAAQHEEVHLGVDTDADGDVDRSFDETNVSGVNNNAYSFDISLESNYTLQEGDVVEIRYPAVDNPDTAGEYDVAIRLNDRTAGNGTVVIE